MAVRSILRHWKDIVVGAIVLLGGYAIVAPELEKAPETAEAAAAAQTRRQAKHVIRMVPNVYQPGTIPLGAGEPISGLREVADEFERLYPDTRLEFINAPVGMREWLVTQLSSGMAPDILQVNVEDIWQDVHKNWYVGLNRYLEAPNPFIPEGQPGSAKWWDLFKYEAISKGKAAPNGQHYCISYDMVETGVFYNKTMFDELGLREPQTWEEFLELMEELRAREITPFLSNVQLFGDWALDLIFDQVYYDILPGIDLVQDPEREVYLEGYLDADELAFLNTKGFFTAEDPRWQETFRLIKEWKETAGRGSLILDLSPFINQDAAMIWGSSTNVQRFVEGDTLDFEWGVFYPPAMTTATSPYAGGHEMCVIGGSAMQYTVTNSSYNDTGNPETSEKLERVVAFLQLMTVPENADKIINEVALFLPNIKGVEPREELRPFDDFLRRRYTTTKWTYTFDLRFNDILMRMLGLYLTDGIGHEGFMGWMSDNVQTASQNYARRVGKDEAALQRRWEELAPLRADYDALPPGAMEEGS